MTIIINFFINQSKSYLFFVSLAQSVGNQFVCPEMKKVENRGSERRSDTHLELMENEGSGAIKSPASFYPNYFNLRFVSATLTNRYRAS